MANDAGFSYSYGWNIYYQKLLGLWTIKDEGLVGRHRAWVYGFMIFIFLCLPQLASLSILWGDLNAMIDCLATNMSFSIAVMKITTMQYRRKLIREILISIKDDWGRAETKEQLNVMLRFGSISRFISIVSFSLTNILIADYMTLQCWLTMTNSKDPNIDPRLSNDLLFVVYFPFTTTRKIDFLALWISQFFSTILGAMCYSAPDSLVSLLVLHVCGQLRIIRDSLKNLVNDNAIEEPEEYWKKLAVIIKRHEQLNELAIVIKNTFDSVLLIQMLACSMIFCFQGYTMFTTFGDRNSARMPIFELGFSVMFAIHTITHFFIYCYIGDILSVESTGVADDFYNAKWYSLPAKKAKAFLFVSHRTKTPLEVKAGKFCTFNLQLFNAVLKNSMGYFSMLVAMKERLVD